MNMALGVGIKIPCIFHKNKLNADFKCAEGFNLYQVEKEVESQDHK